MVSGASRPRLRRWARRPRGGTYTVVGARVTMRETTTSLTGCTPTQYGTYGFSFGSACATLVLTVVEDPCSLRATVLSGQTLTRL